MTLAHIAGVPVEEGVRALALAGSALVYTAAVMLAWLRRR
jgi:hypothetical protein